MEDLLDDELFFKDSGMDQDSEARFIEGYFKLLNGRNANGKINNIPSSLLITNPYLPTVGENLAMGSFEDQKDDSCIWFNWNSLGFHAIYRYYRNVPGFTNGEIQLVRQVRYPLDYTFENPNPLNLSNDPTNVVTGIALVDNKLYWNQPNDKPKMIDAERSNVTRKRLRFNMLLNKTNFIASIAGFGQTTYTLKVYKGGNPVPIHTFIWTSLPASNTYALRVQDFVDAYNASPLAMAQFHLINQVDFVQIEMSKEGDFYLDLSETKASDLSTIRISLVTPDNFYPERDALLPVSYPTFKIDLISRVRYPSLIEPSTLYKTDSARQSNLVKGKVFQFRTRYNYFDYSESCLGAISNIAPNIVLNIDTSQIVNNYIEVDFTDARLSDPSLLSIIKTVDVLVREHNTGIWRVAETFQPYEFAGPGQQICRFFNDGNFAAIDPAKAIKPYDSVGRTCKSLEMVGDRLFDGGILEGYNKPPVEAKVDVTYTAQENPDLFTIKGAVFIYHPFHLQFDVGAYTANDQGYQYNQFIHSPSNDIKNLCFGGFGWVNDSLLPFPYPDPSEYQLPTSSAPPFGTTQPDIYPQRIPLGGFTAYLAGTEFCGVSKQYNTFPGANAIQGFLNSGTSVDRFKARQIQNQPIPPPALLLYDCYNPFGKGVDAVDQNGNLIGRESSLPAGRVFSKFEIKGVPAGKYVLRFASHLITDALLNNGTLDYQKTSTNLLECGGAKDFEVVIEVGPSTADANGDVIVGRSVICDLAKPNMLHGGGGSFRSGNISGYLTDHDNTALTIANTFEELLTDTRIDNARLLPVLNTPFGPGTGGLYSAFVSAYSKIIGQWDSAGEIPCDHNGYFFYAVRADIYTIDDITFQTGGSTGGNPVQTTVVKDYFQVSAFAATPFNLAYGDLYVFRNTNDDSTNFWRTLLVGQVVFANGDPVKNVAVVNTHGHFAKTDTGGAYSIIAYDRPTGVTAGERIDALIYCSTNLIEVYTFVPPTNPYSIIIGTGIGEYDYANPLSFSDVIATSIAIRAFISAMKRGWDGQFGIVYYNEADQKCAVTTIDALKLHLLFYTELDPLTGLQVNPGYPVLTWTIYHRPPEWATKYQWVRQANQQMETWLQWIANKVEYINDNDDGTVYSTPTDPSATMCKINLDNIGYYTINKHPNAIINFTYEKGDRLRPIRDAKNNLFPQYYEFEIIKVIGTDIYIYKDVTITFEKGTLFEIFAPRGDEEVKVFYEFGECYEVKTAVIQGVRQKYHAGPVQDQTYGPVPTQTVTPAIGIFKTGDAYYRTREMQIGTVLATDIAPHQASSEGNLIRFIDDPSVSDFFESKDLSIGRVNLEFGIRELFRQSTTRFTNRYLSDSETNGLSSNEPLNEKQFPTDFGLIVKLILIGNDVLKAIFSNSWQVNMYINKTLLREASGQALIALSDDVIPRTNENERTYGSQHPESISITTEGTVFGWDEQVGVYWRSSGNGLIPISGYKMNNFFTQKSNERLKPGYVTKNPAIYDIGNGQLLHTFSDEFTRVLRLPKATVCLNNFESPIDIILKAYPSNTTIIQTIGAYDPNLSTTLLIQKFINAGTLLHGFTATIDTNGCLVVYAPKVDPLYSFGTLVLTFGAKDSYTFQFDEGLQILPNQITKETISFTISEKGTPNNRWPQFYSFTPEYYGRIRNDVLGFVGGQLWLHDQGPDFNTFYGIYFPLQIIVVFKKDWQKTKVIKGISYKSKSLDFYSPTAETVPTADYPTGQETKLSKKNFKATQAGVYAAMNKDMRDTSIANIIQRITNGRPMRGTFIKVTLENDSRDAVELFSAKIIYFYSELS